MFVNLNFGFSSIERLLENAQVRMKPTVSQRLAALEAVDETAAQFEDDPRVGRPDDEAGHAVLEHHAENAVQCPAERHRPYLRAFVHHPDLGDAERDAGTKDDEGHGEGHGQQPDPADQEGDDDLPGGPGVGQRVDDHFVAFQGDGRNVEGWHVDTGSLQSGHHLAHQTDRPDGISQHFQLHKNNAKGQENFSRIFPGLWEKQYHLWHRILQFRVKMF